MIIRGGRDVCGVHVVKRLLLVLVGYLVGVVVSLISIVILYFVLSSLPGAPSYFVAMGVSPLLILIFPPAWLLVFYVAVILTGVPSLVGALISELFSLRQVWFHGPLGAAIGAGAFVYASPELVGRSGERIGPTSPSWRPAGLAAASPIG